MLLFVFSFDMVHEAHLRMVVVPTRLGCLVLILGSAKSFSVRQIDVLFSTTITFDQQVARLVTAFVSRSTRLNSIQKIHLSIL